MQRYQIDSSVEIGKRSNKAQEFYDAVFEKDEQPMIVTDKATLYDIYYGDEEELIAKIKKKYGKTIVKQDFHKLFWQLLDELS